MIRVEIEEGESVVVALRGSDGEFTVNFGVGELTVEANMPDNTGHSGVIYKEIWDTNDPGLEDKPVEPICHYHENACAPHSS